jgi:gamma-glutamyltranspeptidase/glutathione hydrolase
VIASRTLSSVAALTAAALLGLHPAGCASAPPAAPAPVAAPPVVSASAPPPPPPAPEPAPPAHRFAVATENATASRIAMAVLERGGSAADAAIAGLLGVGVAHPVSSGIGGGGFAMVYDAKTKKTTCLDFRETAPIGIKLADYVKRPPPDRKAGVMVGVPGEVAGLAELHRRWGKLAWSELARGAIDAAEQGFPVSEHLRRALGWAEPWVKKTPRYALFAPGGALLPAGETAKNPKLAATLQRIASEGPKAFYEGRIADDVLATARAAGSYMTPGDLRSYRVVEREPLTTTWEGREVVTMPPPSAGGLLMLETLHMHTKADLAALGYGTGAYQHLLAETFRGAIADRVRAVGDPGFVKVDVAALAAPARMMARRARISLDSTSPPEKFPLQEAGTSHLVVVDAEGNVASVTSTVNNLFGARLVTEGGFVLNDELDDFTKREVEERFAIVRGPNTPRGGARPVSSMTPTIVLDGGRPVLALGGSGGTRIATGVTQVLLASLVFGRSLAEATADPRFETPAMGGLWIERGAPEALVADLRRRGEVVDDSKPNFSAVQAVAIDEADGARRLEAGADPRKGGSALVK